MFVCLASFPINPSNLKSITTSVMSHRLWKQVPCVSSCVKKSAAQKNAFLWMIWSFKIFQFVIVIGHWQSQMYSTKELLKCYFLLSDLGLACWKAHDRVYGPRRACLRRRVSSARVSPGLIIPRQDRQLLGLGVFHKNFKLGQRHRTHQVIFKLILAQCFLEY